MKVCTLQWEDVSVSVKVKDSTKQILNAQKGIAVSGEVLAIIGASGSGKTTLLNYLSGFIGPELQSSGKIKLGNNGLTNKQVRGMSGYVLQEDILQTQLTVYENVEYSAKFKLRDYTGLETKVNTALSALNLEKCKQTRIGTEFKRGVSGGEKKRCCIAMELVNEPNILFLDEPTTGLDSVNAEDVVTCMKDLASQGKIIISTIHQPSVDMLKMFDKLLIMHEGRAVYHGSYAAIQGFYQNHGVSIPNYVNQVEYILTCLNMNESNCKVLAEATSETTTKVNYFDFESVSAVKKACLSVEVEPIPNLLPIDQERIDFITKNCKLEKNGFFKSVIIQMSRTFKCFFRDRKTFAAQILTNLFFVVLAAILFRDLGTDAAGVQNRVGALYFLMMMTILTLIQVTSMAFSTGIAVLRKELMQGQYTPTSYFLGVTIPPDFPTILVMLTSTISIYFIANLNRAEPEKLWYFILVILASIQAGEGMGHMLAATFGEPSKTVAAMPILLMPLQLFSGFLFSLDTVPWVLKPLSWISIFRYCLAALITNEFSDLDCGANQLSCDEQPSLHGYHDSVAHNLIILASIALSCRVISVVIFHLRYRKYYDL